MADELSVEIDEVLRLYGAQIVEAIKGRIIEAGKVRTGAMLESIAFSIDGQTLNITAIDYFNYLQYGTSRGIEPTDLLSEVEPIEQEMFDRIAQVNGSYVLTKLSNALIESVGAYEVKTEIL